MEARIMGEGCTCKRYKTKYDISDKSNEDMMPPLISEFLNMVVMYMFYKGKDVSFLGINKLFG